MARARTRIRRRLRRKAPRVRRAASGPSRAARQDARAQMQGEGALMIGGARDPAEKAADRMAAQALAGGVHAGAGPVVTPGAVHRKCAACAGGGGSCPACGGKGSEKKVARAARPAPVTAPGTRAAPASPAAASALGALGTGRPLARTERTFFEPRFGRDFSGVRVHDGPAADRAAKSIDAQAFSRGQDIAFARGGLDRATMAHELAHVAQGTARPAEAVRRQVGDGEEQAPLRTSGCTGGTDGTVPQSRDPVAEIRQAIGVANGMIGHAQTTLAAAAASDATARGQVRANFCHSSAPAGCPTSREIAFIQRKYRAIAGWLNSPRGPRIVCRSDDGPGCRERRHRGRDVVVEGFTICDRNRPVYICGRSFGQSPRHLAEILIHEAAHRAEVCPPGSATECYHFEDCYPPRNAPRICADSYSTLADRALQVAIEARERSQPEERPPLIPRGLEGVVEEF